MSRMNVSALRNEASSVDNIVLNSDGTVGGVLGTTLAAKADASSIVAPGLVLITAQSFSAVSSVSVNNCFTAAYDTYSVVVSAQNTGFAPILWRLRSGTTDATSNDYNYQQMYATGTGVGADRFTGTNKMLVGFCGNSTSRSVYSMTVSGPFVSRNTSYLSTGANVENGGYIINSVGLHGLGNSYNGMTIYVESGAITGTIRIYGYRDSL